MSTNDSQTNKDPETLNPDGSVNKKLIGYGVDDAGFFRLTIHTDRGICELLGFLEQMKDVIKAYYTSKAVAKEREQQAKKVIFPGIHKVIGSFKK